MRPIVRVLTFVTILAVAGLAFAHEGHGKSFGKGVSGHDTVAISELLTNPDPYVGKVVRVEGTVTGVCTKRGCWMAIASEEKDGVQQTVRIKVEDGVIVFPAEAKGKKAIAEGVFTRISSKQKHAEPEACQKHHGDKKSYLIQGTGALIEL